MLTSRVFRKALFASLIAVPSTVLAQGADDALIARARAIHDRVLTMDTHVDISPANFTMTGPNYGTKLPRTQVDVAKMEEGGLDAAFLIVYVGQADKLDSASFARAHASAIEKFDAIHRLTDSIAPTRIGLARTAADVRRIYASGRKVALIGVENGFPIGADMTNVRKFYDRGARYMSLAHNGHSQLSDSNTGERDGVWMHNGLSPLGRDVIAELNRVGIMIDVSHPSKQSMLQTIALTKAPIIASHSGVRALCNHSRNMDDEQLRALKKNGGVIQLVAFNAYVKCDPVRDNARNAARAQAMAELRKEFGIADSSRAGLRAAVEGMTEERRNAWLAKQEDITARRYPSDPSATVKDFVDHIDYVVKLIGIDHVGISSDFDGGGGVDGWRNASETLNVTVELLRRGYTEQQISKIWSGNLLRVMEQVEKVAKR
jgi:microsomal dipeptidase-like Zn-dependent dipeptidase